jgi:hypothetical protein
MFVQHVAMGATTAFQTIDMDAVQAAAHAVMIRLAMIANVSSSSMARISMVS